MHPGSGGGRGRGGGRFGGRIGGGGGGGQFGGAVSGYDKRDKLRLQRALKAKAHGKYRRTLKRLEAEGRLPPPVLPLPPAADTDGDPLFDGGRDGGGSSDGGDAERKQQRQQQQREREQHQKQRERTQHEGPLPGPPDSGSGSGDEEDGSGLPGPPKQRGKGGRHGAPRPSNLELFAQQRRAQLEAERAEREAVSPPPAPPSLKTPL